MNAFTPKLREAGDPEIAEASDAPDSGKERHSDSAGGAGDGALQPALWKRLTDDSSVVEMVRAWLALQCQMIQGATEGLVLLRGKAPNSYDALASWPEHSGWSAALTQAAEVALRERRGVASGETSIGRVAGSGATAHVAFPVSRGSELYGAVAVAIDGGRQNDLRTALRQLQWGVAWIRERLDQASSEERDRLLDRSRAALDLLGDALGYEGFEAAAMAVVTGLAVRSRCARVSLGVRGGRNSVSVKVISHTTQFGQQMVLVSALGAAMDEALDQRCVVLYPAPADQLVATSAHAELSRIQHDGQVLTVPMLVAEGFVGALTFERPPGAPFEQETVELLELATSIIGPVLEEKRQNDRWLVVKILLSLRQQLVRLLGPGHLVRKLVAAAIVAGVLFLSFAHGVYRVDADAQIEGLVRRAVVAPYDGFIKDATARPGDSVSEDSVLATLEDTDLLLERLKWVTERQEHLYEYDKALAARQPATINVVRSQIDQAEAQIKLLDEQIARIKLRSPISGLVVSGDLSQLIGASVQRGQVLFEVAPLDSYRVILDVDEREIGSIEPGQSGEIVVSALPNERLPFVVDKVTPLAEARSGRNVFRVDGKLSENISRLRPGMEGVGKIEIGRRNLAWIWLHPLLDWARIWSWRWVR